MDQFIQKWLGKRTDYDSVYAYQCVDLILQYLAEVHGITSGVRGNAIDYWTKPSARLLESFEKVTGTPQKGDIVILNPTNTNPYGHIMIAVNATTAIEQNGATGDGDGQGGDEIRYRTIPTSRVAGLLRKKGTEDVITNSDAEYSRWAQLHQQLLGYAGNREVFKELAVGQTWLRQIEILSDHQDARGHEHQFTILTEQVKNLSSRVTELGKALSIKDGVISTQQKEIESLKAQVGDNTKWETLKALVRELVGR